MNTTVRNSVVVLAIFAIAIFLRQTDWNRNFCQFGELLAPGGPSLELGGYRFTRIDNTNVYIEEIIGDGYYYKNFDDTYSSRYTYGDHQSTLLVEKFDTIPYLWTTVTMCPRSINSKPLDQFERFFIPL